MFVEESKQGKFFSKDTLLTQVGGLLGACQLEQAYNVEQEGSVEVQEGSLFFVSVCILAV